MDTLLGVILLLAVALLGYLTGQRFPHLGGWISGWGSRCRAAVVRPPGPWRWWSRLLLVAGALAATAPVWPIIQPIGMAMTAAIRTEPKVNARCWAIAVGSGSEPVSRSGEKIQANASMK